MKNKPIVSVVSPVYQAETIITELVRQLHENLVNITNYYEIILVNDASPDNSWAVINSECTKDNRVKGINLSRNFGQHYAITAGLHYAKGEWVVVMDCDLQDRPDEIINLYKKAQEGFDSVFAQRVKRRDTFIKNIFSKLFYTLFSYLIGVKQDATIANFGIYNRKVINAVLTMGDNIKFFPTMAQWVGFRKFYLPVRHSERYQGKTSYNFKSLMRLALNNVITFSDKPLRLTVKMGFIISLFSLLLAIYNVIAHLAGVVNVKGFTTTVFSIYFIGGLLIMILGIIGLYVGNTFECIKKRPVFIIQNQINMYSEQIEYLKWDSDFFKNKIGKIEVRDSKHLETLISDAATANYQLIYAFAEKSFETDINTLKRFNGKLVDTKILYEKEIETPKDMPVFISEYVHMELTEELESLAYLSGNYSRFKSDKNFLEDDFYRMYRTWMEKSIKHQIADKVFIATDNNVIKGVITLKVDDKKGNIGLFSVSTDSQNKGYGKALLRACERELWNRGIFKLEVFTQTENIRGCKFYEKCGFRIKNVAKIYHFWI
jgi:dolichol-phosphate mannosyltransferase